MFPYQISQFVLVIMLITFASINLVGQSNEESEKTNKDSANVKKFVPRNQQLKLKPGTYVLGLDVFVAELTLNNSFYLDQTTAIGFEFNLLHNAGMYAFISDNHFGGNGFNPYLSLLGFSLYLRQELQHNLYIDAGATTYIFLHGGNDSGDNIGGGTFLGGYVKFFAPIFKVRDNKGKLNRRPSLGLKIACGIVDEQFIDSEMAVTAALYFRFFLKNPKKYVN